MEQVSELDKLVRLLRKMESKMRSGQWIDAWRDCNAVIALIDRARVSLIEGSENEK